MPRGGNHWLTISVADYVVDFLVGDVAVEADGCWHHGCAECRPERLERRAKDARKDAALRSVGYRVVRLAEHEVRAHNFMKLDIFAGA